MAPLNTASAGKCGGASANPYDPTLKTSVIAIAPVQLVFALTPGANRPTGTQLN